MLIDGKTIALEIQNEIAKEVSSFSSRPPCLAVVQIGEHPASSIYVKRKINACNSAGIRSIQILLPQDVSEQSLYIEIERLNQDPTVDGILIQLPLPHHINPLIVNQKIDPAKDVDGFHPINLGRLLMGDKNGFAPCTPLGVRKLLTRSSIEITGKHVVIVGRSLIVGKPLAALFLQNTSEGNATVTILHSHSQNISEICQMADIVVVAIGSPLFLKKEMVKPKAVVIDVGINRVKDPSSPQGYKLVGDADFEMLKDHCSAITPVPGGVGPMTIAMLLSNTLESFKRRTLNFYC